MRLKKYLFLLTILKFILVQPVYTATDGYDVSISSSKASYDLDETAHFDIEVKKGGHFAHLKSLDIEGTFPIKESVIEPTEADRGKLIFNPVLDELLEQQTLTVTLYHKNRSKIIENLKKRKDTIQELIERLKNQRLKYSWKWGHYSSLIQTLEELIKKTDRLIENFSNPLATASKAITVIIDNESPVIDIANIEDGAAYNSPVSAQVSIEDYTSFDYTITCGNIISEQGSKEKGQSYNNTFDFNSDDEYTISVSATDKYSNNSQLSKSFLIDTIPPEINVEEPDDGFVTTDESITVSGTISPDTVSVAINGAEAVLNIPQFELSGFLLEAGPNTIPVKATDHVGNSSEKTISVTRLEPTPKDSDGDGLTDDEELNLGTDPEKWNTDGDRIGDGEEIELGCDPLKDDTDGDGITDGDEMFDHGSNPLKADSDEDSLSDYEEVEVFNTSPREKDTDKDGLFDYDEIKVHHTDPLSADTDSDGKSDKEEIDNGTDPLVADSGINEPEQDSIRNLAVAVTPNSATISFHTDKEVTAKIYYGKTQAYTREIKETDASENHALALLNLRPDTYYHYLIILEEQEIIDLSGAEIISQSSTYKKDRIFKTAPNTGDVTPPDILIEYPADGAEVSEACINVYGSTDDFYALITVNGQEAVVDRGEFWGLNIPVEEGYNDITVSARDEAGNFSEKTITVFYNPNAELKITSTNIPDDTSRGFPKRIEGTWQGRNARILVNGKEAAVYTDGTWVGPYIISKLDAGNPEVLQNPDNYLVIDMNESLINIHLQITGDGNPVDRQEPE